MSADENITNARMNEVALIGAVLHDGEIYERAREIVNTGDFSWECYAWVWEACESLYSQGLHIDTITVGDELQRKDRLSEFAMSSDASIVGRFALMRIREVGSPKNFVAYAENVHDYATKREILQFLNTSASHAVNGRRARDIVSDLTNKLSKLTIHGVSEEHTHPIGEGVSEAFDWVMAAANGKLVGVKTGLNELDKIIKRLFAGGLYIVAARPKQGKTGLLGSIALFVSRVLKKRVLWFSLEMSKMQVALRLISQVANIDLDRIMEGDLSEDEWKKFQKASEIVNGLPIVINDLSSINITQIRQTSRKVNADGVALIIVDYIQLAGAVKGEQYDRRDLEVGAISRGLKHLAGELGVPILAAAQLNRGVEGRSDKRPMLSDLRESGSLEQDADAVMFIYRPEYYENGKRPGEADIIVAAQRNGPVGTAEVQFQANIVQFRDLEKYRVVDTAWQDRADVGMD